MNNVSYHFLSHLLGEASDNALMKPDKPKNPPDVPSLRTETPPKPPVSQPQEQPQDQEEPDNGDYSNEDMGGEEDGMPQEGLPEEVSQDVDLGKIYELKKIYARLIAIKYLIEHYSEPWADDFKERIDESIEMFQIVVSNLPKYKDDINDVIIKYYKFIKTMLTDLEVYVSRIKQDDES